MAPIHPRRTRREVDYIGNHRERASISVIAPVGAV
jgi:hypothetical protein